MKRVNFGSLFLGLLLIFFGLAYLGSASGMWQINVRIPWNIVFPVLVVIAGLSLLPSGSFFSKTIGFVLVVVLFLFVIFVSTGKTQFQNQNNGLYFNQDTFYMPMQYMHRYQWEY